ncbi:MAG: hypothetical protein U9Q66_02875 [Patescibacteria group bacterium]|nr:hypothetical protein [Patescibacteria group bacterium]
MSFLETILLIVIVERLNTTVQIIFDIHQIESPKGATKNNKFQAIKLITSNAKSPCFFAKNNAQRLITIL